MQESLEPSIIKKSDFRPLCEADWPPEGNREEWEIGHKNRKATGEKENKDGNCSRNQNRRTGYFNALLCKNRNSFVNNDQSRKTEKPKTRPTDLSTSNVLLSWTALY